MPVPVDTNFLAEILTVAGVIFAGVITPGPDFIAAAHTGASGLKKSALLVVLGIATGSMIWATLSFIGLSVLFSTFAWTYLVIKLAGAGYLIYLGFLMMRSAYQGSTALSGTPKTATGWKAFRLGLLTDLSNPKTAIFFSSLFAVVMPPFAPVWQQVLVILIVGGIAAFWYGLVAFTMTTDRVSRLYKKVERFVTGLTGGVLTFLGFRLITDR